jgi:hypothetical protein
VVFRITGNNVVFQRGRTAIVFGTDDIQLLGRVPWVVNPEELLAIAVVRRRATPGLYDVAVEAEGTHCVLSEGLMIR